MLETRPARLAALAFVLAALVVAIVGFGALTPDPAAGRYPGTDEIVGDPAQYHGDQVVVGGTVVDTDPLVLESTYVTVIDWDFAHGTVAFTVREAPSGINPGDSLQVFGILEPDLSISAHKTVISSSNGRLYMYVVSFLAGLWVLRRLTRQWRIDWGNFAVLPQATTETEDKGPTTGATTREAEAKE